MPANPILDITFYVGSGFVRFVGSVAVALVVLWLVDEAFIDGRFTNVTINLVRQAVRIIRNSFLTFVLRL
jgi:hypothetical protein